VSSAGDLRMLAEQFDEFQRAMLADAPDESVALARAGWWHDRRGHVHLLWRGAQLATPADYERRSGMGARVRPDFLAAAIKRCRQSTEAFVLTHTHPFSDRPGFSGIDDGGENTLIPKVRARVPGTPHGALVLGQIGASVRVWNTGASAAVPLDLRVIGSRRLSAGAPMARSQRQELALGPGSARALADTTVAMVGVGGLGWSIALSLWTHGVGRLVLVDPDTIEESNLSRLPVARMEQIGVSKVTALADTLQYTRAGEIAAFITPFSDRAAREACADADLLIVSTDNLASRLDADRFARRLLLPVIDAGINIQLADQGSVHRVGGRVNVSWPTGPCLSCMGILTPDALALEADPLGYRGAGRRDEAAVLAFNTVLAGLVGVEALDLLVPFRRDPPRSRYLAYDGLRGVTREIAVPAAGACGTCADLPGAVHGELP